MSKKPEIKEPKIKQPKIKEPKIKKKNQIAPVKDPGSIAEEPIENPNNVNKRKAPGIKKPEIKEPRR